MLGSPAINYLICHYFKPALFTDKKPIPSWHRCQASDPATKHHSGFIIMATPNHAFFQMPLHLLSFILSQLDNTPSLASAIFSHSSFYAAFDEDRGRIMRTIVRNQIPSESRGYALSAYLAASSDLGRCHERIRGFLVEKVYFHYKSRLFPL